MRANKIMNYESILQVLGETGCPFCRFMKNFQAALLQNPAERNIHHLCNFHTWGLAAAISAVMEGFRKQLVEELTRLRDQYQPDTAKWGVLGHAAEFIVSQRGLHA